MVRVKFTTFCDLRADLRIRLATKFWFCKLALTCVDFWVRLARRLQLMWIESVLGHSFLACNLLWPCPLIETSDTELSGIHWSRKLSHLKSRVSHWSGEKQRLLERHDVARAIVLLRNQLTNYPYIYLINRANDVNKIFIIWLTLFK